MVIRDFKKDIVIVIVICDLRSAILHVSKKWSPYSLSQGVNFTCGVIAGNRDIIGAWSQHLLENCMVCSGIKIQTH